MQVANPAPDNINAGSVRVLAARKRTPAPYMEATRRGKDAANGIAYFYRALLLTGSGPMDAMA